MFILPSPRLPIELCEDVIHNLHNEVHTLRACSLTCRAFLPASRYHLFHYVTIDSYWRAEHFLKAICSNPSTSPAAYVRRLGLFMYKESSWPNQLLHLLAICLPEVMELEFDYLDLDLLDDIVQTMVMFGFQKVESLSISNSTFTLEQMNRFIASFPSLTDLSCCLTNLEMRGVEMPPLIPLPHNLTDITLDIHLASFFEQLLSLESHPTVGTITFVAERAAETGGHTQEVGRLLKTLSSSLEYLDLSFYNENPNVDEAAFNNDINLAHNDNLRSICLDYGDGVFTLLSQSTSPHLARVLFHANLDVNLDDVDWVEMEHTFNQQRWANLQELTIRFGTMLEEEGLCRSIRALLPALESRGVLRLQIW